MKMKKLLGVFFALTLFSVGTAAQANSIILAPSTVTTAPGTVQVQLFMDFTESTLGGGIDVFYNSSILDFLSFTFDPAMLAMSDPSFTRTGDDFVGEVNGIAFGNFAGIVGSHLIGTLNFSTIGIGSSLLTLAVNDSPAGPFVSNVTFLPMEVDFTSTAEVIVTPLPAAAWLMISGLGFLVGFGRRKLGVSA
jgi:hypothetical protein